MANIQIPITKNGKTTLATKGTKNAEDIDINVDISPTIQSLSITPSEISQTFNASNVDGYKPVNVSAIQTETPTVDLSLASGNQTVNASSGKYIKSLTITKPSTLITENIKSGIDIGGVIGTLESGSFDSTKYCRVLYNSDYPLLKGMTIQGGLSNLSNYVKATLTFTTATNHTATQIKALNFFNNIPVLVKDNYVLVDVLRQIYGIGDTINVNNTEVLSIGIFLDFSCADKKYKPAIIKYSTSTGLEWVSWYNNEEVWMYGAFSNSYSQYNCLCVSLLCANSDLSKYSAGRSTNNNTTLPVSKCYSLAIITDTSSPQCLIKIKDMILSKNYKHLQSRTSGFSYTTINYTLDDINEINI